MVLYQSYGSAKSNNTSAYSPLKEAMTKQTEEINKNIADNIQKVTEKFDQTNKEIGELQTRSLWLERKARKNNIVVFGLDIQQGEHILQKALATLNNLLDINLQENDINNIYPLGKKSNPPVKIEFVSFLKKISLFKNKEKLKNLKGKLIAIANDLSYEDREIQKKLRKHLKQAREQNIEAKIKGNKLIIDSKAYSANELEELEGTEESGSESEGEVEGPEENQERPATSKNKKNSIEEIPTQPTNKQKKRKIRTPSPKNIAATRSHRKVK